VRAERAGSIVANAPPTMNVDAQSPTSELAVSATGTAASCSR
jgi:hypothetical protein